MERRAMALALAVLLTWPAVTARAQEPAGSGVVEEVLAILHRRGIVDDGEYGRLLHRQRAWESQRGAAPRLAWSGDFRARLESFWFDRDATGTHPADRTRARYRLRLQAEARVNDHVRAVLRLASGQGASRSANQTLGTGADFDPDAVFLDRAYLEVDAPEALLPGGGAARLRFGKMAVPFRWRASPDSMLWDRDLSVEGVAVEASAPWQEGEVYARGAWLIADENAAARDPHLLGAQLGARAVPSEDWELGARLTGYAWRSLDAAFLSRAALFGNLPGGLTGSAEGDGGLFATEIAAYLHWAGHEAWPLTVYAHWVRNHDASSTAGASAEDTGFGLGLAVGDKRRFAELAAAWFRLQANAWPAQFVDSPLLGGRSNQEVLSLRGTREILPGTDLRLTLFFGEALETGPAFTRSVVASERVLLQTDVMVRF
jgi:hypothetical protein